MTSHRDPAPPFSPAAPLDADALRWLCPTDSLGFSSTAEVEPIVGIVGQETAVDALRFGLRTRAPGQHVFVRGLAGTGRLTLVQRLLKDLAPEYGAASDRAYVRNFAEPERPNLLTLPRGAAARFRDAVAQVADFIDEDFHQALDSQVTRSSKAALDAEYGSKQEAITKPFNAEIQARGLAVVTIQNGQAARPAIAPVVDGKPVPAEQLEQLRHEGKISDEKLAEIAELVREFSGRLEELSRELSVVRTAHQAAVIEMYHGHARTLLGHRIAPLREDYPGEDVAKFLDGLIENAIKNYASGREDPPDPRLVYAVNVIKDANQQCECPVVLENVPSVDRLIGSIQVPAGADSTAGAHTWLRVGAMMEADGGYLILEAKEVVTQPEAWQALIRTLRSGKLEIVPADARREGPGLFMRPASIPVSLKVILVGDHHVHAALEQIDDDFSTLFKVVADFDSTIPRNAQSVDFYTGVLAHIAEDEELLHFSPDAVARLTEHGARIAGQADKLTARFGRLADLAREASFLAADAGRTVVAGTDVSEAIRCTKRRADLPARKFRERVARGTVRIQTRGRAVGQVNGLAVMSAGPLTYGIPARITATVAPGTGGTVNIEGEADLSGSIHTKGFYILGGLLRHLLHADHPVTFDASIAFEQSYGGIDGDSASGAEMCCLLSAMTELPLRQDLSMTGAIDQVGNILPIGGANEKIEGFYDTCVDAGLTGTQGVIIPETNVGDLMLREDVVEAAREGRFCVHAVSTIHEALELFMDRPAGRWQDGGYPEDSILGIAVQRARRFWERSRK